MECCGLVVAWGCCAILGAAIGQRHDAAGWGALCGIAFGPLGVIAAFALDHRPQCHACRSRIAYGASVCPFCHSPLCWLGGQPVTPDAFRADQMRRAHRAAQAQLAWTRRAAASQARWSRLAALPGRFDTALCRALGEENAILHAFARLVLYLALPAAIGGAACYWLVAQ